MVDIKENGVWIMRGNISGEDYDAIVRDFNKVPVKRLCNLQLISEAAKRICFNKCIAEILQVAFT